ncbi:hypothetical protein E5163_02485 [Marinicauda algicola]|uniref:DUF6468 domain-containing protein n=1 Tax=Marinicauda algicola TaxID=2029849 RepID=A0A4S2H3S0_9PROT|nr:DUF6468 domain-containing protein [Marinicauda algicola]TGY90018.1 hypothetical protein E5163_02485 [Marinicauda algicola]
MSAYVLIFEGLVALLMLGAGIMCWRVDRRLKALREGQDGLKATIGALNDAVDRARASLAALDRASKESGGELKTRVEEARRLADELRILSGAGEARAERLAAAPRRREPSGEIARPRRESAPEPARARDGGARETGGEMNGGKPGRLLEALKTLR